MLPRTRWTGAGPAGPTRCPWRDYASGSCPSARSTAGRTPSSSTQCWPQQPSRAGPNRTCSTRSPGGRLTTSGSTPCSRRSPTSAPPPAGRACRCARHCRTWPRALAIQRHNDPARSRSRTWMTCSPSSVTQASARCSWPAPRREAGWHSTPPSLPFTGSRAWW